MFLSEPEEKFLLQFEKNMKKIYLNYISVGVLFCAAIVCLIMGITSNRNELFFPATFFAAFAGNGFMLTRKYHMLFSIISKMKQAISELEQTKWKEQPSARQPEPLGRTKVSD